MPDAVRAEISPWFLERSVMDEDDSSKRIPILDDTAPCRTSGLMVYKYTLLNPILLYRS